MGQLRDFDSIGQELGLSKETVRLIYNQAIRKLRIALGVNPETGERPSPIYRHTFPAHLSGIYADLHSTEPEDKIERNSNDN